MPPGSQYSPGMIGNEAVMLAGWGCATLVVGMGDVAWFMNDVARRDTFTGCRYSPGAIVISGWVEVCYLCRYG